MVSGALALVLLLAAASPAPARREALLFANCPREGGEYTGSYRGRVLLQEAFLAGDDLRPSIEQQLRYLWGYFRNDAAAHGAMQVTLSAEPPVIEILSRTPVRYGRRLPLPYPTQEERLRIDDPYTRRAVARGEVKPDDRALLVTYQIRFKAAICGRDRDPPPALQVPLPRDPWLAYWHVPAANHRPLRYHDSRAVTNPCADDDFADLPHPFYYWYDWLPTRHGPDDDGRAFDCRPWLRAGQDYDFFDVKLERTAAASHDFGRLRSQLAGKPLTATVLVGAVDHAVTDLALPRFRALLAEGGPGALATHAVAAQEAWAAAPPREPGTRAYLALLAELREVMTIERHTTTIVDEHLLTEVHGRLAGSGSPLRLRVWLGLTDVFGPRPPRHWPILRQALGEDQIVVYVGHAGIGENVRLANIEQHTGVSHAQMAAALRRSPLRLVAFLSCYSYMYFGQDLLDAGAERADGAFLLFTGIAAVRHEAGPLAVLDLVDRVLAPDARDGRLVTLPRLGADEFWLVKEVSAAP
jgi:hypothetical protein